MHGVYCVLSKSLSVADGVEKERELTAQEEKRFMTSMLQASLSCLILYESYSGTHIHRLAH